jgi:urease accessory protein UreE
VGDFQTSIDVYIDEKVARKKRISTDTDLGILIAEQLKESVLISDNDINPYTWLLIKDSQVYEVEQVEKEDERMVLRRKNTQSIS